MRLLYMSKQYTLQTQLLGGITLRQDRLYEISAFLNNPYGANSSKLWYNAVVALISFNNDCQYVIVPSYNKSSVTATLPNGKVWYSTLSITNTYENFINDTIYPNQNNNSSFQNAINNESGFGYEINNSLYINNYYTNTEQKVVLRLGINRESVTGCISLSAISSLNNLRKGLLLLELSGDLAYYQDKNIVNVLNYYWNKYPKLYPITEIIDTTLGFYSKLQLTTNEEIIANNIDIMNYYYNQGYRIFSGFSRSTILAGVLTWFNDNIGSVGISLCSSSTILDIPKKVYRLQNTDLSIVISLTQMLEQSNSIYYIYSSNEVASLVVLDYLNKSYSNKLISFAVETNSSNLTLQNIQNFYKNAQKNDITISYLFDGNQNNNFYNLFSSSYVLPTISYDISISGTPNFSDSAKEGVVNLYNYLNYFSFSTSELYREGLKEFITSFVTTIPDYLLLYNNFIEYETEFSNTNPSHNSILQFNKNNDLLFWTILVNLYTKDHKGNYTYIRKSYNLLDPIAGYLVINL